MQNDILTVETVSRFKVTGVNESHQRVFSLLTVIFNLCHTFYTDNSLMFSSKGHSDSLTELQNALKWGLQI